MTDKNFLHGSSRGTFSMVKKEKKGLVIHNSCNNAIKNSQELYLQ